MKKIQTLCLIHQHPKILLGMKKRGFGEGRWNGFGGNVEDDETIEDAALRELLEEVQLEVKVLEKVGILEFVFESGMIVEVHVFRGEEFTGEPVETEEMAPQWFHVDEIPFDTMWADDEYWVPLFLRGKKFKGKFFFDSSEGVKDYTLDEVDILE